MVNWPAICILGKFPKTACVAFDSSNLYETEKKSGFRIIPYMISSWIRLLRLLFLNTIYFPHKVLCRFDMKHFSSGPSSVS